MAAARDLSRPLPATGSSRELDLLTANFNHLMASVAEAESKTEAGNTRLARLIWNGGVDPRGTAAELYLKFRGLVLTDDACAVLRFHAAAK